jgi:hypothetical protein
MPEPTVGLLTWELGLLLSWFWVHGPSHKSGSEFLSVAGRGLDRHPNPSKSNSWQRNRRTIQPASCLLLLCLIHVKFKICRYILFGSSASSAFWTSFPQAPPKLGAATPPTSKRCFSRRQNLNLPTPHGLAISYSKQQSSYLSHNHRSQRSWPDFRSGAIPAGLVWVVLSALRKNLSWTEDGILEIPSSIPCQTRNDVCQHMAFWKLGRAWSKGSRRSGRSSQN